VAYGHPWTKDEDALLRPYFRFDARRRIQALFPSRTWLAIKRRGNAIGLRRSERRSSPPTDREAHDRFWRNVRFEPGGCWVWTGPRQRKGYGIFYLWSLNGKQRRTPAHQFSYSFIHGAVPSGYELDHLCRETSCVHPLHVEPVTHRENMARGLPGGVIKLGEIAYAKPLCVRGHARIPENLYTYPDGGRRCRICAREDQKAIRKRRKRTKVEVSQ